MDFRRSSGQFVAMTKILFLLVTTCAAIAPARAAPAPFTFVEAGKGVYRLDDAVRALGGGAGTLDLAPGP